MFTEILDHFGNNDLIFHLHVKFWLLTLPSYEFVTRVLFALIRHAMSSYTYSSRDNPHTIEIRFGFDSDLIQIRFLGRLVGGIVVRFFDRFVGLFVGQFVGRFVGQAVGRFVGRRATIQCATIR